MLKSNSSIFVASALCFLFLFTSCDKEFNTIGVDIVGNDDFLFETASYDVTVNNNNFGPVQTNNLPTNALGIYTNSLGETTTANFVTQLELAVPDPSINLNLHQEIESVVLSIPYFSTKTGLASDGLTGLYELDSIYGSNKGKLKLSIYESSFYMPDYDPVTKLLQEYYSNQMNHFESNNAKKTLLNTDGNVSQNAEFFFSNAEYDDSTTAADGTVTAKRTAPEMRINLDKEFFKDKFFSAAATSGLASNNALKNYFRGLYFKVENDGSNETNQMLMNFKKGTITITYKEDLSVTDPSAENKVKKTIVLNLTGNTASLLNNQNPVNFESDNVYLKGGEGAMAVINLFNPLDADGNGISDELDELRKSKILINDAALTIYANKVAMPNGVLPNRIYLYDATNNTTLLDYDYDTSTSTNKKLDKRIFGGILNTKDNSYKIKLTYHIRNMILDEKVKNVSLGLVITENINSISNSNLKTPFTVGLESISKVPTAAVMNPLNAVFYSNTTAVPSDKKLKFEIYYTKPN